MMLKWKNESELIEPLQTIKFIGNSLYIAVKEGLCHGIPGEAAACISGIPPIRFGIQLLHFQSSHLLRAREKQWKMAPVFQLCYPRARPEGSSYHWLQFGPIWGANQWMDGILSRRLFLPVTL